MNDSFEECYFRLMSSQAVEKAIRFCGGNFRECDIYKEHFKEQVQPA